MLHSGYGSTGAHHRGHYLKIKKIEDNSVVRFSVRKDLSAVR